MDWPLNGTEKYSLASKTTFFLTEEINKNTLNLLIIIHIEDINLLDFDDKSDRNCCFVLGNLGIVFKSTSTQHVQLRENG